MKIYGIVGWKNAGKTSLMERLVAELTARGHRVATVKHAHHAFDLDQPGKDSHRHRAAGAGEVLLASHARWALLHENDGPEPPLAALLAKLAPADIVLVEGYKRDAHAKIEVYRDTGAREPIQPHDPTVRAVAADCDVPWSGVPVLDLNDTGAVADFILAETGLGAEAAGLGDACFLPQTQPMATVAETQAMLKAALSPVTGVEVVALEASLGRALARDVLAVRANPPGTNSAMDGYAFAHGGETTLRLVDGRSAAGAPFAGTAGPGEAVRILTGALMPDGADTVVMQEDVTIAGETLSLARLPPKGANVRPAGEDVAAGAIALPAGTRMGAAGIGLAAAVGLAEVAVHKRLRVGVLSTGDELAAPGSTLDPARTYDANRPMLIALLRGWGHEVVDLGPVPDNRDALRAALDAAVRSVDAIVTSGGASAGDEDHVSALLGAEGHLAQWRVALKPGKPLVLAQWQRVPLFGLPGNPVSAFVTAALFARPALGVLAGEAWREVQGFDVPAAFSMEKRAGRRTFLRARMGQEGVEVFRSDSSGLISSLSWAEGLVELPEEAVCISPGTMVRFVPFGGLAG